MSTLAQQLGITAPVSPRNRPERILRTLEAKLDHPVRLILYERAAPALAFPYISAEFAAIAEIREAFRQNAAWALDLVKSLP